MSSTPFCEDLVIVILSSLLGEHIGFGADPAGICVASFPDVFF